MRLAAESGATVCGIDLLPEMLRVARRRVRLGGVAGRTLLSLGDASSRLPFASGSFDRILAESVLGFQDAAAARGMLGELRRVLRPGGRAVALEAVWREGVAAAEAAAAHAAQVRDFGLGQASPQPWCASDWAALMRGAGFTVEVRPAVVGDRNPSWRWRATRAYLASKLVSRAYRFKEAADRSDAADAARYGDALLRHAADGALIEPLFFVLEKPAGP